jgi:hypothetical protein
MANSDMYFVIVIIILFAWRVAAIIQLNTLFIKYKYNDKSIDFLEPDKISKKPYYNKHVNKQIFLINLLRILTLFAIAVFMIYKVFEDTI